MVAKRENISIETYDVSVDESRDDELVASQADELNGSKDWWQKSDS